VVADLMSRLEQRTAERNEAMQAAAAAEAKVKVRGLCSLLYVLAYSLLTMYRSYNPCRWRQTHCVDLMWCQHMCCPCNNMGMTCCAFCCICRR
jgi:hypothetical protein